MFVVGEWYFRDIERRPMAGLELTREMVAWGEKA